MRLEIYKMLGKKVRTLVDKDQPPGFHSIPWDGLDGTGVQVASGIYLYRIQALGLSTETFVKTKKMLLIK